MAGAIRQEVAAQAQAFRDKFGYPPGLAAVLVGDNPASQVYVRNKRRACEEAGIQSWLHHLPADTSEDDLLALVRRLNADARVHGILVQLPLPRHISEAKVIEQVDPCKDVDGFTPDNLGRLAAGQPRFVPCTPHGIQQLLIREGIGLSGAHVVILGRSTIVGKPLALLLLLRSAHANATVTVCHTGTRHLAELTRQADILVAAMGSAQFVKAHMVRPGATVVDVGINRLPDGSLVGDVAFAEVSAIAGAITPVPGGIGPMTVAMLLYNTVEAARLQAH